MASPAVIRTIAAQRSIALRADVRAIAAIIISSLLLPIGCRT
ncbi:hypothetical protein [Pigmentiphaga humi]|nr:hypothetical protein [Pigmentiphaga humi]